MGKAILISGGTSGVGSDDVTASKEHVLKGYKTVTADSNDEVAEGTIKTINTAENDYNINKSTAYGIDYVGRFWIDMPHGNAYYHRNDDKPHTCIEASALGDALQSDIVNTKTATSKNGVAMRGTLSYKGNGGKPNNVVCPEMWYYDVEGSYVTRFDAGAYYNAGDTGQWKPYVSVPVWLAKQATNYHPEKTLSDTVTCQERGQVKMVDTQAENYKANMSTNYGIDTWNNHIFWMDFPHGNAYYYRADGHPHCCIPADALGDAGADSLLEWTSATSKKGVKFSGAIKRWVCNTGDVISAVNGEGFAWDDSYAGRGRGIVAKIPNNHYIQGANWVFLPSPNLRPENILENVDINGTRGIVPDYRIGRPVFRNATFNTTYVGGVANKDFQEAKIMRDRTVSSQNYGRYTGGTTIKVYATSDLHFNLRNERVGFVLDRGILMTFFRQIKITYRVDLQLYTRAINRTAGVDVFVGVYAASDRKRMFASTERRHRSHDNIGDSRDADTYVLVIDTTVINEDVFLALCATPYSDYTGSIVSGDVTFTKMELIN